MKRLILVVMVFLICFNFKTSAQEFEVPKNYVLKVVQDYAKYEKDIIACVNWLENTPLNIYEQKRIEANTFFMKWLTGSPTVTINLNADIVTKCTDKNPQLMMLFMAGWTRFSLENSYSKDQQKGYYEGFKTIINVYKKGISIKKDKDLEDIIELFNKGELENWIKNNVK
ncbi:MAG: hypothetical protein NTY07_11440 [Bacteroidia bacterium]|nr:hypothetical protein [Bacteroidia bacterium]